MARLGHHRLDTITPFLVVGCPLVRLDGFFIPVHLKEDEPVRLIFLLQQVKANHAGFFHTVPGVSFGGFTERDIMSRQYVHMHLYDDHACTPK